MMTLLKQLTLMNTFFMINLLDTKKITIFVEGPMVLNGTCLFPKEFAERCNRILHFKWFLIKRDKKDLTSKICFDIVCEKFNQIG